MLNLGSLTVANCTFSGNSAIYGTGGGMGTYGCGGSLVTNCIFIGNSASHGGGGMVSGGVSFSMVTNCTFSGNSASGGGGGAMKISENGNATITNSIFWGDTPDELSGSSSVTYYNNVQGGWLGAGNIEADPCFVESGYWADADDPNIVVEPNDPNAIWIDGDYHLQSQAGRWEPDTESWVQDANTSPSIDAGSPSSSIGWEPYPNGGRINMGAYGGTEEASKSYFGQPVCEKPIAGDINGDCVVDWKDFAIMAFHWLEDNSQ